MNFINLFSVPISITSKSQALALVGEWVKEWKQGLGLEAGKSSLQTQAHFPKLIVTPNPEMIVAAQSDPALMKALQSADLSVPDGIGVIWALHLLKNVKQGLGLEAGKSSLQTQARLPDFQRLSGLDLMEGMILQGLSSKESPLKILLLGGRPGVAQAAAATLQTVKWLNGQMAKRSNRQNPNSTVQPFNHSTIQPFNRSTVSAVSGPQHISAISKSENNRLISQINQFSPDLLFVAFGHPKQEKWLTENRERLTAGVAMAVGGALDQIADPSLRPPPYINSIGLGWLYRLLRQPWRIKRQLALLKFIGMVVKEKLESSKFKVQKNLTFVI